MRHSPKRVYKWEDWVAWTWGLLPGSPHQSQPGGAALWCLCPQLSGQSLLVCSGRCSGGGAGSGGTVMFQQNLEGTCV